MGRQWPSEKKFVPDPITGVPLEFLTSTDGTYRQSKIYQTHRQWTTDGKWLIFRGTRETGSQAFAVNEETGQIVQVTETGFIGMLCAGNKTMKLYVMAGGGGGRRGQDPAPAADDQGARGRRGEPSGQRQILEIDLEKLFADAADGSMKPAPNYQRVCGTIPTGLNADGNMGLDANDDFMYGQSVISMARQLDHNILFGIVPLKLCIQTNDKNYLDIGKMLADRRWEQPEANSLTDETRFWNDDIYMITILHGNPIDSPLCIVYHGFRTIKMQQMV
jgi:hypothetical protein